MFCGHLCDTVATTDEVAADAHSAKSDEWPVGARETILISALPEPPPKKRRDTGNLSVSDTGNIFPLARLFVIE